MQLMLLGWLLALAPLSQAHSDAAGQGFLEGSHVEPNRTLILSGWAAAAQPNAFVTQAQVWVDDQPVYRGRLGYAIDRPDVAHSAGNPLWQSSGFHLPIRLPASSAGGTATVRVVVTTTDGGQFELGTLNGAEQVRMPEPIRPHTRALVALLLALLLPVLAWQVAAPWRNPRPDHAWADANAHATDQSGAGVFAAALLVSFALLVAAGWTGSSLVRLLGHAPVVTHDATVAYGQPQEVRSDEWLVVTPLAISQLNAPQAFSSINPLHGLRGQNMNVVGMTGAPVANFAALARPATWGFFVLDLRRALAWDWWLPFFGCFAAVWLLLRQTFQLHWKPAALLAVGVAFSGYSVSWSGWPAYTIGFAAAATWMAQRMTLSSHWMSTLAWAAGAGWAVAGLALVLYPAWQIPLAYLLLATGVAWLFSPWRPTLPGHLLTWLAAAIIGGLTAGLLLGAWWLDGRDAIQALRETIYPGARVVDLGGYVDPWHLTKGLTNHVTLYTSSLWSIPSDSGGYLYVIAPLLCASVLRWLDLRRLDAVSVALWLFMGWLLTYMFVGFPEWLARASLWSMAPAFRTDIALGLAQTLVLAWLLATDDAGSTGTGTLRRMLMPVVAIGFAWHTHVLLGGMPAPSQDWLMPGGRWLICGLAGLIAAWLVAGKTMRAATLLTVWALAIALPFNPLGQAPTSVTVAPALHTQLAALQTSDETPSRLAVVRENLWANALAASGVAVLNTTFYDPPLDWWRVLDPAGRYRDQFNRYQHLHIVWSTDVDEHGFTVAAPNMDRVELRINPARFDFSRLPVQGLLTNTEDAQALQANPSVRLRSEDASGWVLFEVAPPIQRTDWPPEPATAQ